jgi:hypothetical protein
VPAHPRRLWYLRAVVVHLAEQVVAYERSVVHGQRSSVYLADDLAAAVKASGTPLAELVRRGLAHNAQPADQPADKHLVAQAAHSSIAIGPGEPSPGVLCAGPGCFQRDTARYGLRRLVLCAACAAALQGQVHRREVPPGAARVIQRGTAA